MARALLEVAAPGLEDLPVRISELLWADPPPNEGRRRAHRLVQSGLPVFVGFARAADVIVWPRRMLLHAGPPFRDPRAIPQALLERLAAAANREGWCSSSG